MEEVVEPVPSKKAKEAEADVQRALCLILQQSLPDFEIEMGKNLLYKIEVDPTGSVTHATSDLATRGQYAFQTDLLISKGGVPLVTIELKSGSFSSHDVITYSWKASRHKQVYPYLRYGFVLAGATFLGRRFVTHNEAFDFALALPDVGQGARTELLPLLQRQIESAQQQIDMMRSTRIQLRRFESIVQVALEN